MASFVANLAVQRPFRQPFGQSCRNLNCRQLPFYRPSLLFAIFVAFLCLASICAAVASQVYALPIAATNIWGSKQQCVCHRLSCVCCAVAEPSSVGWKALSRLSYVFAGLRSLSSFSHACFFCSQVSPAARSLCLVKQCVSFVVSTNPLSALRCAARLCTQTLA